MKKLSFALVLVVLLSSLGFAQVVHQDVQTLMDNARSSEPISVIVHMQEEFDVEALATNVRGDRRAVKAQVLETLAEMHAQSQAPVRNLLSTQRSATDVHYFRLINAVSVTADKDTIEQLAQTPGVGSIVLDRVEIMINPVIEENTQGTNWGFEKINVPLAHERGIKGQGVVVAVLDTGIDTDHKFFNIVDTERSKSFVRGENDVEDGNGHGTHCATTIAGPTNVGVAPEATIVGVKVLSARGSGTWSGVAQGIEYAAEFADVISMSLGGYNGSSINAPERAVAAAVKAGVHFAIAAGNSGPRFGTIGTPGCVPVAVTVGALSSNDQIARFSSRGKVSDKFGGLDMEYTEKDLIKPDVAAPGVNIFAGWKNGGTRTISGTSMATPHVAGVMALVLSEYPDLTPAQLKEVVTKTNVQFEDKDETYGWGRVSIKKMLEAADAMSNK